MSYRELDEVLRPGALNRVGLVRKPQNQRRLRIQNTKEKGNSGRGGWACSGGAVINRGPRLVPGVRVKGAGVTLNPQTQL